MHDITLTLSTTLPVWPGDPSVRIERVKKIEEGANSNVSELHMRVHSGTHIDAPVHFLNDSTQTAESVPLDILVGFCAVVEVPEEVKEINREVLEGLYLPQGSKRILFKTRNSQFWKNGLTEFQPDFVGITEDGAQLLIERGYKLVGLDYLSISPYKRSRPTHEAFLKAGVTLLEGVDLSRVGEGYYSIFCLPLKLEGSDGAPARVILIEEE
jgi:arylformamidase